MSLRVLLADESDTIKKVFQLALQDLQAEVKSVHSGLDVIDVAKTFKPDIIFADVLLQKKNGYEICLLIKQSTETKHIPVVLMWSSFMELDQTQYQRSLANDQLEKPFDADLLRDMVQKHTPALDANPMDQFLSFPKTIALDAIPGIEEDDVLELVPPQTSSPKLPESTVEENTSEFNLAALLGEDDGEAESETDFGSMTKTGVKKSLFDDLAMNTGTFNKESTKEPWKEKDLSQFQVGEDKSDDLDKFEALNLSTNPEPEENTLDIFVPAAENFKGEIPFVEEDNLEPLSLSKTMHPPREPAYTAPLQPKKLSTTTGLSDTEIEALVRAHTEEVIKMQLKDSLLQVIEKVVREELGRIIDEELRLQQDAEVDS